MFKYQAKLSLAKPLGQLMVNFAVRFLDLSAIDLIVPVPLHRVKQRQRQFNQAQLLAQSLATAFGKKLNSSLLFKVKSGTDQVKLPRQQRLKNVQGAFKVKPGQLIQDKNILLVDDVLTTQATANECAKILRQAGAKKVNILALARSK